ncbi:hypothetical protein [Allochromatium warmingii]|uniref:hypothetical protein n=1 Tax=Allochromatium warmingii TaxID=61595 RepID=UPI001160DEFF|nr:hypothetical protein [Allochromatium warmingii]
MKHVTKIRKIILMHALISGACLSGCTTETIHYVERSSSTPSSSSSSSSNPCQTIYKIYDACYRVGVGKSSRQCAILTKNVYQGVNLGNRDLEAKVSLMCGLACNQAANNKGFLSYSSFSTSYCN